MQINRLFEIVYILLEKKTVTAKELAEHFEVSKRTIYRDIDTLSIAGIPIYTSKGRLGGISIIPNFVLNKSILSDKEQNEILSALQGLNSLTMSNTNTILNKLSTLFKKDTTSWIHIDFSYWRSDVNEQNKFNDVKDSIIIGKVVSFDYYNSHGDKTTRIVEPLKLLFKGQDWYLYGYCRLKNDFRIFKIKRIRNLYLSNEKFSRDIPVEIGSFIGENYEKKMIQVVLKFDCNMAYRLFDEFTTEEIEVDSDGDYIVRTAMPDGQWIYGYIMSYGENVEVLEPKHIRKTIADKYSKALRKYTIDNGQ